MPYPTPQPLSTRTTAPDGRRYRQLNPKALVRLLSLPEVKSHSWRAHPFENPISNVPKIKPHTWRARQCAKPKPAHEPIAAPGTVTPRRYAQGYVRRGPGYPEGGPTPATVQGRYSVPFATTGSIRPQPQFKMDLSNCNWHGFANTSVAAAAALGVRGAVTGGMAGAAAAGGGAIPGAATGAVSGAALGALGGGAGYAASCWW